ncbi:MAG: hypothetical protein J7578_18195, partial [Chitinophagaceae bacterium]|nr:hypothetical protein [Chitinophagaceae bacterium]
MKRIIAFTVFVIVMITSAKSQTIIGKFDGPSSFEKVYLYQYALLDHKFISVDSSLVRNGKYEFNFIEGEEPSQSKLRLKDERGLFLWTHEIDLFLTGDSILVVSADSFNNARVLNSATNYEYAFLNEMLQPAQQYYNSIIGKIVKEEKGIPADIMSSKEYIQFSIKRRKDAKKGIYKRYEDFIKENPSSWISLYALKKRMGDMDIPLALAQDLIGILDDRLKQSPSGLNMATRLDNQHKLQIGLPAPAIRLPNANGK